MSSTTKPTPINAESIKKAAELDTTSDLYRKLSEYERSEMEQTNRKKNMVAREMESMGEIYLNEIQVKEEEKESSRLDMIDYIITNTKDELVKPKTLYDMSYEDVKIIHLKAQDNDKSWFRLITEFVMGW